MNIALVIENFYPLKGGREASTAQIASGFADRGHTVTILCQDGEPGDNPAVTVRRLLGRGGSRAKRLRKFATLVQGLCREGEFDIVHSMLAIPGVDVFSPRGGSIPAQLATIRRRDGKGRETLSRIGRTVNLKRRLEAKFERQLVADPSTLILTNSPMVAGEYHRYYGRTEHVVSVFNAVDLPDMDEQTRAETRNAIRLSLGISDEDTLLLTAATNFRLKGVYEAIDALRFTPPDIHLLAVGANNPDPAMAYAKKRGLADRVHTLPPQASLMGVLSACDAVVLLSWYDTCARVILEALSFPRPAMTTKLNGVAEILASGAGYIVQSPAHCEEVAAAFVRLSSPSHREACLRAARNIGDKASMDRQVEETLHHYESHLQSR
ncbi:MAG: glycosyltransferase family 4 protein [Phycisphaerales bacterium]|jgi:UDP-glucose:(heptosyl)LPS alpha-1,3-glucosyltransferase|nr:glycosyltransferase family 4 protein [Phycisphaerales bacterium]MBT7171604.1 glycosyltransferase family 4 protein [Phycisphaerales bacterium]